MNEQTIAIIIGFLTVVGLRVLDYYLPKGYISKWAKRHGVKDEET